MPSTTVTKSKGKTVYVDGIRVWEQGNRIHVASEDDHTSCRKDSDIGKFFSRFLEESSDISL